MNTKLSDVDHYLSTFPAGVRVLLEQIRATIRQQVPEAEESISYGIPAYFLNGRQVMYFAGFKKHVSVYPVPREHEGFKEELAGYKGGKGTAQFPLNQPLPLDLIARIVQYRVQENQEKALKKKAPKSQNNGFGSLSAPARRALENKGITSPEQLAELTEKEVLDLHGLGKSSLPKLRELLAERNLDFKK